VRQQNLTQVEAVLEMDAEDLKFPENTFDKVVAMYVVSVVSDPSRLVDEMRRVCKLGGEMFIVNHFRSRNGFIRALEGLFSPLAKLVGFHPDLALEDLLEQTGLDVVEIRGANLFGYWKVLRCQSTIRRPLPLDISEPIERDSTA
jgi:phosphatidylethanolamine/phosphatidyl-N-methylethanolamine N-methyltransferase